MIKAFIFDLGNVIEFYDMKGFARAMAKRYGISAKRFEKIELRERRKHDGGTISTPTYLRNIGRAFGIRLKNDEYYQLFFSRFTKYNVPLLTLVRKLKRHYTLLLLSNNSPPAYAHTRQSALPKLFARMLFSFQVKRKKPDPLFFRQLLRGTGITSSECVFVDDRRDHTTVAATLGMRVITYTTMPNFRRKLAALGITTGKKRA